MESFRQAPRLTESSESQIFLPTVRSSFALHDRLVTRSAKRFIDIHTAFDNVTLNMRKAFDNVSCSVLDVIARHSSIQDV